MILKLHKTWWLTILLAYLVSAFWLGGVVVCVPYVILQAPLGLISLFNPPATGAATRVELGALGIGIHIIFWALFFTGAVYCKKLPAPVLIAIYGIIVALLLLTLAGCSRYYEFPEIHG